MSVRTMRKGHTAPSLHQLPQRHQAVAARLRSFRLHQTGPDAARSAAGGTTKTKI